MPYFHISHECIVKNNNLKILLVLAFPKCGLPFLCCHHCTGRDLQNLVQISFIKKTQQILHISGKVESTLKADHILEMSRLSKIKDDLQFVLLQSCFVGHPVHQILICGSK